MVHIMCVCVCVRFKKKKRWEKLNSFLFKKHTVKVLSSVCPGKKNKIEADVAIITQTQTSMEMASSGELSRRTNAAQTNTREPSHLRITLRLWASLKSKSKK